jgi:hypothetical protein
LEWKRSGGGFGMEEERSGGGLGMQEERRVAVFFGLDESGGTL